jgi:nitrate reductase delta subunit
MTMFALTRPPQATRTLRVLAALLGYPAAEMRAHLEEMGELLQAEAALSAARLQELRALIAVLQRGDAIELEADYVQLFDRGRATALHLFEHVHGDSRDRGPAMIDLAQTYAQAGLLLGPNELPDYLPAVLEFASTLTSREARDFIGEFAHILNVLFNALQQRNSAYASVLGALLELAGESAQAVKIAAEEPLDESWAEPVVFDGCSSKGQARPGQPQPITVVRKNPSTGVVA